MALQANLSLARIDHYAKSRGERSWHTSDLENGIRKGPFDRLFLLFYLLGLFVRCRLQRQEGERAQEQGEHERKHEHGTMFAFHQ